MRYYQYKEVNKHDRLYLYMGPIDVPDGQPRPPNVSKFAPQVPPGMDMYWHGDDGDRGGWNPGPIYDQITEEVVRRSYRRSLDLVVDIEMGNLRAKYGQSEISTWDMQEREAQRFLKEGSSCFIEEYAQLRKVDPAALAKKIVNNAVEYRMAVAKILVRKYESIDKMDISKQPKITKFMLDYPS